MLTGQLPLAGGWREEGETTVVGHFTQQPPPVPEHLRIVDYIRRVRCRASWTVSSTCAVCDPSRLDLNNVGIECVVQSGSLIIGIAQLRGQSSKYNKQLL